MDLEYLSCPICSRMYHETDVIPLMFPCGHTYCSNCTEQLFQLEEKVCPEDGEKIEAGSPAELPKNFALIRMVKKRAAMCQEHNKELEYICIEDKIKI
jgi:hypothetical protein